MATARSGLEVEDPTGLGSASEGIKTLASAIIADPSKRAQAGYYGTKAREALIDAAAKTSQMNMMPAFMARTNPGMGPVSGSYAPAPGIVNGPMMFTPDSPSIAMPSQPSLAVTVAPGGPPQLPPPGQVIQQLSRPDTPGLNTGSPPPASPPVPGASPAPNTTTTNGQVPQNDAQGVHPGSVTPPGGGQKMSGPAAPNGAPAPITPAIANFMAMGAAAGMPAEQMKMIGAAYVSDAIRTGAMDQNTGARVLAEIFDPARVYAEGAHTGRTVLEQQGQNYRQGVTEGGLTRRHEITEGGLQRRHDTGEVTVGGGEGGGPMVIQRKDIGAGRPGYDSPRAVGQQTATNALVDVPAPGGGYRKVSRSQAQAENLTIVDPKVAQDAMENITVITDKGAQLVPRWQAQRDGLAPAPTTPAQVQAEAGAGAAVRGQPVGPAIAAATPPAAVNAEDAFRQNYNRTQNWQRYYPPTTALLQRNANGGVLPVGALAGKVDARAAQIKAEKNLDDASAHAEAIREMQASGELPSAADVDANRPAFYDRFTSKIGPGPDGKQYLYIDTSTPAGDVVNGAVTKNPPPPQKPAFTGYGYTAPSASAPAPAPATTGSRPARPSTSSTPPGGAKPIGRAPAGTPDGTPMTLNGVMGVTRGGLVYPQ